MIRKDKKTFKDGSVKTQIRVTEGYRPYPNASPKQRTVKSFGYLEDQADTEAFWKEVNACNDSLKQLNTDVWCRLAKQDQVQDIISFAFKNSVDADIFINKAFAEGKGVVTTDIENEDGSVVVFCRASDLINESGYRDAVDALIDTELSLNNQSMARRFAIHHDRRQIRECMDMLERGESFVIHNGAEKRADYLSYKDGVFSYNHYDRESDSFIVKESKIDLSDRESLQRFLEHHTSFIHNTYVSTEPEFEAFMSRSDAFIRSAYVSKQKLLFKEVLLDPEIMAAYEDSPFRGAKDADATMEGLLSTLEKKLKELGLEDVRPEFSIDFLEELKQELETELKEQFAGIKESIEKNKAALMARTKDFYESLHASGLEDLNISNAVQDNAANVFRISDPVT